MIEFVKFIEELKSLKPVWVSVNDDDQDTSYKINRLIRQYEQRLLESGSDEDNT